MNTKFLSALTATAAATALLGATAPAQAASFGADGISFEKDQAVTFKFQETHGAFQSSLKIYEVNGSTLTPLQTLFEEIKASDDYDANEWKGSLGNTV